MKSCDKYTTDTACSACPFSIGGKPNQPVPGENLPALNNIKVTKTGSNDALKGILVGDHPSQDDARLQRVFSGQTGHELDNSLRQAGLVRSQLALVNTTL